MFGLEHLERQRLSAMKVFYKAKDKLAKAIEAGDKAKVKTSDKINEIIGEE